MKGMCM